ncbi:MAG: MarC family protein [Parvibaculaceae bacterium]
MPFGIADIFVILLITIGPLKSAIVYATLTARADGAFRRQVAIKTVVTAAIVIVLFVVAGEFILQVFHISLPALKIAGGLILLLFALHMVLGEEKKDQVDSDGPSPNIAVYPLAMPLMATPQGIVAVVTIAAAAQSMTDIITLLVLVLIVLAINLVVLLGANKIIAAIGPATLMITGKVVGILLAGLAVQLMISAGTDLGLIAKLEPHN